MSELEIDRLNDYLQEMLINIWQKEKEDFKYI